MPTKRQRQQRNGKEATEAQSHRETEASDSRATPAAGEDPLSTGPKTSVSLCLCGVFCRCLVAGEICDLAAQLQQGGADALEVGEQHHGEAAVGAQVEERAHA